MPGSCVIPSRLGHRLLVGLLAVFTTTGALLVSAVAPAQAVTDYSTTPTHSWYPTSGVVRSVLVTPTTIYLGGSFTRMRNADTGATVTRNRLAAIDRSTLSLTSWDPGADNTVWTLASSGDVIYAGGDFTNVAGGSAVRIAAITTAGNRLPGFSASANNAVRDFAVTPEGLYVAGRFGNVNGTSRSGVARLDASTGALQPWRPVLTGGRVFALAQTSSGGLLIGGNFDVVGGVPRQGLAQVDTTTATDAGWAPGLICDCPVLDLTTDGSTAYAAVGGGGGGRAVAWPLAGGSPRWVRQGDGDTQAVDVYDGRVYVGGHFGPRFLGADRHQLAVLDATSGALQAYSLPFTGNDHPGLWAVHADGSGLYLGGGFALSTDSTRRFGIFGIM